MKYIVTDTYCMTNQIGNRGNLYPSIGTKIIAICEDKVKAQEIQQNIKNTIVESGYVYHNIQISEVEEC